jgi:hypothetical protein
MSFSEGKIRFQSVNRSIVLHLDPTGRRLAAILLYSFRLAHLELKSCGFLLLIHGVTLYNIHLVSVC